MDDEDEGSSARDSIPAAKAEVDKARHYRSNLTMQREAKINSRGCYTQIRNDLIMTFLHHFLPLALAGKCTSAPMSVQQTELL